MVDGEPSGTSGRRNGEESAADSYRRAGPYLDASWQLAGSVGLWTLVGWWLDGKFHTRPWLLVAGSVLGVGLGFYLFFRIVLSLGKAGKK